MSAKSLLSQFMMPHLICSMLHISLCRSYSCPIPGVLCLIIIRRSAFIVSWKIAMTKRNRINNKMMLLLKLLAPLSLEFPRMFCVVFLSTEFFFILTFAFFIVWVQNNVWVCCSFIFAKCFLFFFFASMELLFSFLCFIPLFLGFWCVCVYLYKLVRGIVCFGSI